MENFWFDVIWAILVTLVTIGADWVAGQLISAVRALAAINQTANKSVADKEALTEIRDHLERFRARRAGSLAWGADLVAVSISLDIAALGIWISDHDTFPFFKVWNTSDSEREIEIWGILLLVHFVLLLVSIIFKHFHGEKIETVPSGGIALVFQKGWLKQNGWMISCNLLGFFTLLSSFVVLTYRV
jgi:hypothetical protein